MEISDDIDGTPGASTVKFGLDGKQYTIDLSPEHESALREALALYVGHATTVSGKATRKSPRSTSRSIDIRDWARAQGIDVSERGRLPQSVIDAYDAAQAAPTPATDPVSVALAFEPAPAALV